MLLPEGYELKSTVAIKGENPGCNEEYRTFIFDRTYVTRLIISKVIVPLYFTNLDDLNAVVKEAWEEYYREWQGDEPTAV